MQIVINLPDLSHIPGWLVVSVGVWAYYAVAALVVKHFLKKGYYDKEIVIAVVVWLLSPAILVIGTVLNIVYYALAIVSLGLIPFSTPTKPLHLDTPD